MKKVKIESFNVIGISVRTTNQKGQAAKDIGELWSRFMSEGIIDKIPNKIDSTIYSLYTEYESDHNWPYTTILGCKVSSLETIPEGMVSKTIEGDNYAQFVSRGDVTKGHVYDQWVKIWKTDLGRKYTTDFEVYGEKAQDPTNAEVEIFVAVN